MDKKNNWYSVRPIETVRASEARDAWGVLVNQSPTNKGARPGDMFRSPKAILERHQGLKPSVRSPFESGR